MQLTVISSCPSRVAIMQIQSPKFFVFLIFGPHCYQLLFVALLSFLIRYLPIEIYSGSFVKFEDKKLPFCDISNYSLACNFTVRGGFLSYTLHASPRANLGNIFLQL